MALHTLNYKTISFLKKGGSQLFLEVGYQSIYKIIGCEKCELLERLIPCR